MRLVHEEETSSGKEFFVGLKYLQMTAGLIEEQSRQWTEW